MKQLKHIILVFSLAFLLYSCQNADGNSTGSEYVPDMAHSLAVEANTYNYYFLNTWDKESTLPLIETSMAKLPVKGTVPRGYAGHVTDAPNSISVPANGSVPYHYEDSEEGRTAATAEILSNPFPITAEGLTVGSELYTLFCAICHGQAGKNGDGIYASGIYPLAPANLIGDSSIVASSSGRYYHAIMYGKNAMGAYKDKMSYEERWQVIHYIRSMQAKEKELEYNASVNTLNSYGIPYEQWAKMRPDKSSFSGNLVEEVTDDYVDEEEAGEASSDHDDVGEEHSHGDDNHSH